jgi:hypothetical protein
MVVNPFFVKGFQKKTGVEIVSSTRLRSKEGIRVAPLSKGSS